MTNAVAVTTKKPRRSTRLDRLFSLSYATGVLTVTIRTDVERNMDPAYSVNAIVAITKLGRMLKPVIWKSAQAKRARAKAVNAKETLSIRPRDALCIY